MRPTTWFGSMLLSTILMAQDQRPQVLTLGVFHFNFPNLDARQVAEDDRIDVLAPQYQAEITDIVDRLARFAPTVIVIERTPAEQSRFDSLYHAYLAGRHALSRSEEEQIGFRLAKRFGLQTLHCTDEWGRFTPNVGSLISGADSAGYRRFEDYFNADPDGALRSKSTRTLQEKGILAALRELNDPANIERSLGDYLIGLFKYEEHQGDFTGVDFETGRWFNRNLRIFRNILRIPVSPQDRILVIYGAGHMNLLNTFFRSSPEFKLVSTIEQLR
ncbi:MAG: hypothetical protein KIT10_09230 [Flavobacteriales bacterium]|nr:hypothetical protein [Flavobacteriales bacterium]